MRIRITMRYHFTPGRMPIIKKARTNREKVGREDPVLKSSFPGPPNATYGNRATATKKRPYWSRRGS